MIIFPGHLAIELEQLSDLQDHHYGTNAVFFYLETVLFLCFKHRAVFF
jgi:hypothetical protein